MDVVQLFRSKSILVELENKGEAEYTLNGGVHFQRF